MAGVVRPHGQLVDHHRTVTALHQFDGENTDHAELVGDGQGELLGPGGLGLGRPGAGVIVSTQIPLRCTDSEIGYAAAWPDGDRTTRALSSRVKSMNSSAMICTPSARPPNGSAPGGGVDPPDALPVVAASGRLGDHRPAVPSPKATSAAASATTRLAGQGAPRAVEPVAHDRLVLRVDQGRGPGPYPHPGRLQVAQQSGRNMLVIEGHHVTAGREGAYGLGSV